MKLFVIDASPLGQKGMVDLLSDINGIEIAGSTNDMNTIHDMLRENDTDVIIMDIEMPERNGIDILTWIKARYPSVIIIICSNLSYPQYRMRCREVGAEFFFDKSTEFQMVPETVRRLHHNSIQRAI